MSEPIVFISHHRIKEGKLDGFKQFFRHGSKQLEASKPGTAVFLGYTDEDATEVSIIHVFPDADAMQAHLQGADERAKAAYEFLEPRGFEVYGKPAGTFVEMLKQTAGSGHAPKVAMRYLGGYIRSQSG